VLISDGGCASTEDVSVHHPLPSCILTFLVLSFFRTLPASLKKILNKCMNPTNLSRLRLA
jgi:hypothetical protein